MRERADRSGRLDRVALYYLLFASLWILTSDWALGWLFPDDWRLGSLLKGLLFVLVTAGLLHLMIRQGSRRMQSYSRRARAVFAAASDGILVLDDEGTLQDWNDSASALLGLASAAESRKPVWTLLPGGTESTWQELRQAGEGERELEMLRPDGSVFPAVWRLRRARVGEAEMLVAFVEDLTARRALERQLVQAQKMESVGRLAAGVTHDLNNLLSVILGHAECLGDHLPPGHPGRPDLEGILNTAGRAALLSRQLLTFSRQPLFHREVRDIGALLKGLEPMLRGLVGENVSLEIRTPAEKSLTVVDPNRLEQVVINLAVNSRDAMPRGGRLLLEVTPRTLTAGDLTAEPGVKPGNFVQIRVADTGEGMDQQTLARIFDPFFTTKPPGTGTGLGLSMVYGLVQQFGGVVRVDSQPGQGTDFRVLLPRVSEPLESGGSEASASPAAPVRDLVILVVEDDPDLRDLGRRVLERAGHRVLLAGSAVEAFRVLDGSAERVDLLLTDIGLPGMDGNELARLFRVDHPRTPVLLMSAYAGAHRSGETWLASNTRMIEKPFKGGQLLEQVSLALVEAASAGQEESAPDREAGRHEQRNPGTPTPTTVESLR